MTLTQRLKQLRLERGYSQGEMASQLKLDSAASVSHYESGLRGVSIETLIAYADVFNMTVQELIAPVDFGEVARYADPLPFEDGAK